MLSLLDAYTNTHRFHFRWQLSPLKLPQLLLPSNVYTVINDMAVSSFVVAVEFFVDDLSVLISLVALLFVMNFIEKNHFYCRDCFVFIDKLI